MRSTLDDRFPCLRLDLKSKPRGKSNRAQCAKTIFPHSLGGHTNGSNKFALQIFATMKWIAKLMTTRRIRDCIDGVVPSGQIFIEGCAEIDNCVPAISIDVATKGRHLVHDIIGIENSNCAEVDAHRYCSREEISHLLRMGGSCQIPVEMGMAEYRIANGSAHAPCLEACFFESVSDFANFWRRIELRDHVNRP